MVKQSDDREKKFQLILKRERKPFKYYA